MARSPVNCNQKRSFVLLDKNTPLEDRTAFSTLFETHHRAIFGYILRRTGNVEDSADLAADTFHKVWLHLRHFSYRGVPVKVWLYRIATNEVNQYFRRAGKSKKGYSACFHRKRR